MSPLATYLIETSVTLVAIVTLAALVLYAARRLGVGRPAGPLRLIGRLPLDGRRAIYLVRVEKKLFVLGGSEAGLHKLGELEGELAELDAPAPPKFREVLARVVGKGAKDEDDHAA